jgi:hypothetical protein
LEVVEVDKRTMMWVLAVYLLISFVPALSLTSLLGKAKGGGKGKSGS